MQKLLLLDLDGTIRRPKSGATFINYPEDQEIIPESQKALKKFTDWICVGITNQGGVAAGHKSLESAMEEQTFTIFLCPQIQCIYFCPDFEGKELYSAWGKFADVQICQIEFISFMSHDFDLFRKPGIGMIQYAQKHFKVEDIKPLNPTPVKGKQGFFEVELC